MKSLEAYITEELLNESAQEKEFIDAINDIINKTNSIDSFNKKCEDLIKLLDQYESVEINNMVAQDIEKGAVYCEIINKTDRDIEKSSYNQQYGLLISFGLTGGSVEFKASATPDFAKDQIMVICPVDKSENVDLKLIDFKQSLGNKSYYKTDDIVKKIGKSTALKKFLKDLRKMAGEY